MYFIKTYTPLNGWKARNRWLYPTKREAQQEVALLNHQSTSQHAVADADHWPDKGLLMQRHGFS